MRHSVAVQTRAGRFRSRLLAVCIVRAARARRQVPVQRRAFQAGLGGYLSDGGTVGPEQGGVFELARINHGRPPGAPAVCRGHRPRM